MQYLNNSKFGARVKNDIIKAMKKIFLYTSIFLVGFVFISLWTFYLVISPPEVKVKRSVVNLDLPFKPLELTTEDSVKLSAWFIPSNSAQGEKRAVILLHGYQAEKSDMLGIASTMYPNFSLLLLDLRSFGESSSKYTTLGIKERGDVNSAVSFLKKQGYEKIGIFGVSLGSAAALLAASENKDIDSVGIDTSFSNIKTLGYKTYSSIWLLKYPIAEMMGVWEKIFFGASISKTLFEAGEKIEKPVLVAHIQKDSFSIENALKLRSILKDKNNARFFFPNWEKEKHGIGELDKEIKDFFEKTL